MSTLYYYIVSFPVVQYIELQYNVLQCSIVVQVYMYTLAGSYYNKKNLSELKIAVLLPLR